MLMYVIKVVMEGMMLKLQYGLQRRLDGFDFRPRLQK